MSKGDLELCTEFSVQVHFLVTQPEFFSGADPKQYHLTAYIACTQRHQASSVYQRARAEVLQGRDQPTIPGRAPTVLVMPRRKGACRGDRSA